MGRCVLGSAASDRARSTARAVALVLAPALALADGGDVRAASHASVLWVDNDDLPVARPARDEDGDAIWWDGASKMTVYPASRVLDLANLAQGIGETLGLVDPIEAANVNDLDEVPDSSWFTNRHALERLSDEALSRGPNLGPPPADGPLTVISGKTLGATPGFVMRDAAGAMFLVKPDAAESPELATGAELVASKLVWAAGYHVPEYHLVQLDPAALALSDDASTRDRYNRKRPMHRADLEAILSKAAVGPDGRIRAVASRFVPGHPVGPPVFQGRRADDPNDTVDHEDRRELRGLRVVAAWLNLTDTRRGNFLDAWVPSDDDPASGHVEHWVLDFSSAFGAANVGFKPAKFGHEYLFDPLIVGTSVLAGGLWEKPWERPAPALPELGHFTDVPFDPDRWKPTYPNPLYDHATALDDFWGAKLVTAFSDDDIRRVVATGDWSRPEVAEVLTRELVARRDAIAARYLKGARVSPLDRFRVEDGALIFEDLAVSRAGVDATCAGYRVAIDGADSAWIREPSIPLPDGARSVEVEIRSIYERVDIKGRGPFTPAVHVTVRDGAIAAVERDSR